MKEEKKILTEKIERIAAITRGAKKIKEELEKEREKEKLRKT